MVKVLILAVALAGCQATGGSFCAIESPIRLTNAEIAALSDASVARILAHNQKGAKLCGWRP